MLDCIDSLTQQGNEGNFAFKFTGLISTDIMTKLSTAQYIYLYKILQLNELDSNKSVFTIEQLKNNLSVNNINLENNEINSLFSFLKFSNNSNNYLTKLEVYGNGHLFLVDPVKKEQMQPILNKIITQCSANISSRELEIYEQFS